MFAENQSTSSITRCSKLLKATALICALSTFQCIGSTDCDATTKNKSLKTNDRAIKLCQQSKKRSSDIKKYVQAGISYAFYNKINGYFEDHEPPKVVLGHAALGIHNVFKLPVDLEAEAIYYDNKYTRFPQGSFLKSIDYRVRTIAALANAKYTFENFMSMHTYVGVGLGIGHVTSKTSSNFGQYSMGTFSANLPRYVMQKSGYNLAYQIFVGTSKSLNEVLELDARLRLLSLVKFADNQNAGRIHQVAFSLGLKYTI